MRNATIISFRYVSTFVRACALYDAALNDRVTIHLGSGADVIGISLLAFPPNHGCSIRRPEDVEESVVAERLMQWSSEVGVSHMTQVRPLFITQKEMLGYNVEDNFWAASQSGPCPVDYRRKENT